MKTILFSTALIMMGGGLALHIAQPAQLGIKRTALLQDDLGIPGREVVQVRVDFAPGTQFAEHSHPGEEIAYVLEGTLEYRLAGQPPVTLQAGEALFIPAGKIHAAKNVGTGNSAELATYIVEKGKPLVVVANEATARSQNF